MAVSIISPSRWIIRLPIPPPRSFLLQYYSRWLFFWEISLENHLERSDFSNCLVHESVPLKFPAVFRLEFRTIPMSINKVFVSSDAMTQKTELEACWRAFNFIVYTKDIECDKHVAFKQRNRSALSLLIAGRVLKHPSSFSMAMIFREMNDSNEPTFKWNHSFRFSFN